MRITTPAAQLAAQSASPCSAYKRARSICQCVVKFFGSASSRSGGRGMPPGKRGCQKVLRRRKLFCIFCPQNGSCLSLPPSTASTSSSPTTSSSASSSSSSSCAYFLRVSLRFGFHFSFRFLVSFLLNALIAIYQIGK